MTYNQRHAPFGAIVMFAQLAVIQQIQQLICQKKSIDCSYEGCFITFTDECKSDPIYQSILDALQFCISEYIQHFWCLSKSNFRVNKDIDVPINFTTNYGILKLPSVSPDLEYIDSTENGFEWIEDLYALTMRKGVQRMYRIMGIHRTTVSDVPIFLDDEDVVNFESMFKPPNEGIMGIHRTKVSDVPIFLDDEDVVNFESMFKPPKEGIMGIHRKTVSDVPILLDDEDVVNFESKFKPPKEEYLQSAWEQCTSTDQALQLLQQHLPSREMLHSICKRLGKGSDIVKLITDKICHKIFEMSGDIVHVFAAYKAINIHQIHFVAVAKTNIDVSILKEFDHIILVHVEADNIIRSIIEDLQPLTCVELNMMANVINKHSENLLKKHRFISAISACKLSYRFLSKHYLSYHLYVAVYVHPCTRSYSSIPIDENPIPNTMDGFRVLTLDGCFKRCTNTARDFHSHLRMGCKITSNFVRGFGTLGGFVDHPYYGLCGVTCLHVLYDSERLQKCKKEQRIKCTNENNPCLVYQPSTEHEPIGRVVEACYIEGGGGKAGVDLALIQLENRYPNSGSFPQSSLSTTEKVYDSGRTWGKFRLRSMDFVYKFGCVTELSLGKIVFTDTVVREIDFHHSLGNCLTTTFYNQYEIFGINGQFCEHGDSGAFVFVEDTDKRPVCIGMVEGYLNDNRHGIITPITSILDELNVSGLKSLSGERILSLEQNMSVINDKLDNLILKMQQQSELLSSFGRRSDDETDQS